MELSFHKSTPRILCGFVCLLISPSSASAQRCQYCTKWGVDMPISLAVGTVRTPAFTAKRKIYFISIESRWNLPAVVLRCKMGFGVVPPSDHCKSEIVLGGNWRVLEGQNVVAQGDIERISPNFDASKDFLRRYIGEFHGEKKHQYVVEVTFAEDGSSLDVTNPQLKVSPGFDVEW